eukprot:jgi/Mesvir1/16253/Mv08501-RA.2
MVEAKTGPHANGVGGTALVAKPAPLLEDAAAALFGDDTYSLPGWFKTDAFSDEDFNADDYIADLRRSVPLETLRSELNSHLLSLKNELVELINRDYADFVNLSTKLVDVDGAVLRMRAPLTELRSKMVGVRDEVAKALSALDAGLKRRADASAARQVLELLLDTSHVVCKVEKLLAELDATCEGKPSAKTEDVDGAGGASAPEDGGRPGTGMEEAIGRLLERIASEVNRLKFYVAHGQDLPFVMSMEPRITAIDDQLGKRLQAALRGGISRRDTKVIFHCLRAYATIDDTAGAEEVFRELVVAPFVDAAIPPATSKGGLSGDDLASIYRAVTDAVKAECGYLIELTLSANSGLHSFDFLCNSVLKQVLAVLAERRPHVFSPGNPAAFLQHYNASMDFLAALEEYLPTQAALAVFRGHAPYADFLKKWNLTVYFTLRFQDIAGALDAALAAPMLTPVAAGGGGGGGGGGRGGGAGKTLALQQSAKVVECVRSCWHEEVYVPGVADRFFRLTLQLLARYVSWLLAGVDARKATRAATKSPPPGTRGDDSDASSGQWALNATAEDLILVHHDMLLLSSKVKTELVKLVLSKLALPETAEAPHATTMGGSSTSTPAATPGAHAAPSPAEPSLLSPALSIGSRHGGHGGHVDTGHDGSHSEPGSVHGGRAPGADTGGSDHGAPQVTGSAVRAAMEACVAQLLEPVEAVEDIMTDAVVDKCVEVLKQLRGITATYRMTNKPLPTRHSHFVPGVLQPLKVGPHTHVCLGNTTQSRHGGA